MATVDTDALRAVAGRFETEVAANLAKAKSALGQARSIEYSNFTNVHIPLAVVYVEAWNFANRDLDRKVDNAGEFAGRLRKTAADWDEAEHKSTVQQDGRHG